jgi:hypothetical protein
MTSADFDTQMRRLSSRWPQTYVPELQKLIWREVAALDPTTWTGVADRLLGECRQPPLLPEIRECVAKERERTWTYQKRQHAQDARDFAAGTYHTDEVKEICRTIRRRVARQVPDNEWAQFLQSLNNAVRAQS